MYAIIQVVVQNIRATRESSRGTTGHVNAYIYSNHHMYKCQGCKYYYKDPATNTAVKMVHLMTSKTTYGELPRAPIKLYCISWSRMWTAITKAAMVKVILMNLNNYPVVQQSTSPVALTYQWDINIRQNEHSKPLLRARRPFAAGLVIISHS